MVGMMIYILIPPFLFTCHIRFVLSQIWQTLIKFIERNNNIYNTKFVSLNPCEIYVDSAYI